MRPVPLSDELLAGLGEDVRTVVIAAPDGDLTSDTIRPVEAAIYIVDLDGTPVAKISIECRLEDGDLADLTAGGSVLLSFLGVSQIPPFMLDVLPPAETDR